MPYYEIEMGIITYKQPQTKKPPLKRGGNDFNSQHIYDAVGLKLLRKVPTKSVSTNFCASPIML